MLLMLCLSCLATPKKLGHQASLSLECKGMHSTMEYRKKPILPKYSVKIVQLPQHQCNEDLGSLFLDPTKYGNASEAYLRDFYRKIFDQTFDIATTNPDYENFRSNVKILFDLIDDKKYDKSGNHSVSYQKSRKDSFLPEDDAQDVHAALSGAPTEYKRLVLDQKTLHFVGPEGLTLRSRIMDEAVFESADKVKIVIGPRQQFSPDQPWENFKVARSVDDLNLSTEFLARAGIVSQAAEHQKELELIVVAAPGVTEADIRKKVDAIVQSADYTTRVQAPAPKELNVAMMGSVGLSAAYHYYTRNFIFTLRSGIERTWGKFCQTIALGGNTEGNPELGFGGYVGAGVDYKWAENVAVGLEGGMRLTQLKVSTIKDPVKKLSTWFSSPYAQLNCTFFSEDDTSLGLFSGYTFAKEFTVKSTGARIPYGSPCKIGGLYGGLRVSKYF